MSGILQGVLSSIGAAPTFTTSVTLSDTSFLYIDNSYMSSLGWNGTDKLDVTFTVPNGVTISSNGAGGTAVYFDLASPVGSKITVNVNSGGWIVGGGGQGAQGGGPGQDGGDAIFVGSFTSSTADKIIINNSGTIAGGGGAGGGWMTGSGAGSPPGATYIGDYGTKRGGGGSLYAGGGGNSTSGNTSTVVNASGTTPGTGVGGGGNGGAAGANGGNFTGVKGGGGGGGLGGNGGSGFDNSPVMLGGLAGKSVRGTTRAILNNSGTVYGPTAS